MTAHGVLHLQARMSFEVESALRSLNVQTHGRPTVQHLHSHHTTLVVTSPAFGYLVKVEELGCTKHLVFDLHTREFLVLYADLENQRARAQRTLSRLVLLAMVEHVLQSASDRCWIVNGFF